MATTFSSRTTKKGPRQYCTYVFRWPVEVIEHVEPLERPVPPPEELFVARPE
jgi:hypothetical protein